MLLILKRVTKSWVALWTAVFLSIALFMACQQAQAPQADLASVDAYTAWTMEGAQGTLFVIGGGSRSLELMSGVTRRMPSLDASVVVLPMASSEPDTSMHYGIKPFLELGCTQVQGLQVRSETCTEAELEAIRNAAAIYLCGGDQARFMEAAKGSVSEAIREAFRRGAIISGSSAGAAMMSRIMITGDQQLEPEYESTYRRLREGNAVYQAGLGLIEGAIIDQHFVERSRYNRAFTALHDHAGWPVIGIGESTALVLEPAGASVEGEGHVVVFHPAETRVDGMGQIALHDVRLDFYLSGDEIEMPHLASK